MTIDDRVLCGGCLVFRKAASHARTPLDTGLSAFDCLDAYCPRSVYSVVNLKFDCRIHESSFIFTP